MLDAQHVDMLKRINGHETRPGLKLKVPYFRGAVGESRAAQLKLKEERKFQGTSICLRDKNTSPKARNCTRNTDKKSLDTAAVPGYAVESGLDPTEKKKKSLMKEIPTKQSVWKNRKEI